MRGGPPARLSDLLRRRPELGERVTEARLRRQWSDLVGLDVARQTQPLSLRDGILTIGVASSPWLHQLTLVADELRGRLNRGADPDVIRGLRFQLHALESPKPQARVLESSGSLTREDSTAIDRSLTPIRDPALRAVLRRVMVKARLSGASTSGGGVVNP